MSAHLFWIYPDNSIGPVTVLKDDGGDTVKINDDTFRFTTETPRERLFVTMRQAEAYREAEKIAAKGEAYAEEVALALEAAVDRLQAARIAEKAAAFADTIIRAATGGPRVGGGAR